MQICLETNAAENASHAAGADFFFFGLRKNPPDNSHVYSTNKSCRGSTANEALHTVMDAASR